MCVCVIFHSSLKFWARSYHIQLITFREININTDMLIHTLCVFPVVYTGLIAVSSLWLNWTYNFEMRMKIILSELIASAWVKFVWIDRLF